MPIDYSKYPKNWKTEIRPAILKRAGNRCEKCGVLNGVIGYRDRTGKFHVSDGLQAEADALDGEHIIRIVLTVAHLNHDLTDSSPENLAALCQKCHLTHDAAQHRASRWRNRHKAESDLL